jgi:anti-sigma-K factor RskA
VGVSEHHEDYLDRCAAEALGCIDPVDRRLLDEHLELGCSECEAALVEFSKAVVLLAASASTRQPGSSVRGRVLAAAAGPRPDGRSSANGPGAALTVVPRAQSSWTRWVPAALAAGLAVAAVGGWVEIRNLRGEIGASQSELQRFRSSLEESQRELKDEQLWAAVLGSPSVCVVPLQVTPDGQSGLLARAIYEPETQRAVLLVQNLKAPGGRDYQLWEIRGAAPRSLGLIKTDAAGHAVLRLENLGERTGLSAFAISLEPQGGAPTRDKPTGPVVMVGTVPT